MGDEKSMKISHEQANLVWQSIVNYVDAIKELWGKDCAVEENLLDEEIRERQDKSITAVFELIENYAKMTGWKPILNVEPEGFNWTLEEI